MQTTASKNYFDSNRKTDTDILEAESSMRNASKTNPIVFIFVGIFFTKQTKPKMDAIKVWTFSKMVF